MHRSGYFNGHIIMVVCLINKPDSFMLKEDRVNAWVVYVFICPDKRGVNACFNTCALKSYGIPVVHDVYEYQGFGAFIDHKRFLPST